MIGLERRLSRLFGSDGRVFVVAIDHGLFFGSLSGLENFGSTASRLIRAGVDAIQLSPEMCRFVSSEDLARVSVVARLDTTNLWRNTPSVAKGNHVLVSSVRRALEVDAQCVVVYLLLGPEFEDESIAVVSGVVARAHEYGLPVMVEPLSVSGKGEAPQDPVSLTNACRIAVELGADLLKVDYPGDASSFTKLVSSCQVPVLLRGGPKKSTEEEAMNMVKEAILGGARGLVFGRNIWQSKDLGASVSRYKSLVHKT